jgi:hypothetical protein
MEKKRKIPYLHGFTESTGPDTDFTSGVFSASFFVWWWVFALT